MVKRFISLRERKAVSELVSYVMLIVFVLASSILAYQWLKTYVPQETLNCPDGVSVFVKSATFNSSTSWLNVIVDNNGRFDIAGFFIHGSNNTSQATPSIDLSRYLNGDLSQATNLTGSIIFLGSNNSFSASDEKTVFFNVPSYIGPIYKISLIPIRFQVQNNKEKTVVCGDAKILQDVSQV